MTPKQEIYDLFFSGTVEQAAQMEERAAHDLICTDVARWLTDDPNSRPAVDEAQRIGIDVNSLKLDVIYYLIGRADERREQAAQNTQSNGADK